MTTEKDSHPILKFLIQSTYIRKSIYGQADKIIHNNRQLICPL